VPAQGTHPAPNQQETTERTEFPASPLFSPFAPVISFSEPINGEQLTIGLWRESSRFRKFQKKMPNLFQENAVLGEETACLDGNGRYNQKAPVGSRTPRPAPFSDPFFVTAAIAGGASMLLTSQNRIAVTQAKSANLRGQVLAAVVVHQSAPAMRPYSGMRRTRHPIGLTPTFPKSKRWLIDARHQPDLCGTELALRPQLWARLVLSKMARS
jgi:hypothetical protein